MNELTVWSGVVEHWIQLLEEEENGDQKIPWCMGPYGFRASDTQKIACYVIEAWDRGPLLAVELVARSGLAGHDARLLFGTTSGRQLLDAKALRVRDSLGDYIELSAYSFRCNLTLFEKRLKEWEEEQRARQNAEQFDDFGNLC